MERLRIKLSLLTLAVTLLMGSMACQRNLDPEQGCGFLQNGDAQRVSWKLEGLPIPLYVHSSVPQDAYPSIEEAIKVYNEMFGRQVFTIRGYGSAGSAEPSRDGFSVIYWMDTWEADRPREQGRTTVYWSGDTIYEADLRINNSNPQSLQFHYTQMGTPAQGVDLKSLFVHEMGHMLGLDHNEAQDSIMRTELADGHIRTQLSSEDKQNLTCEYRN